MNLKNPILISKHKSMKINKKLLKIDKSNQMPNIPKVMKTF
ncbi:MAG: Hypothetical protein AJITA_01131 [Acetilactobacillus jinshanensis]